MKKVSEIWKAIVGYEGHYEVSSFGRVRGVTRSMPGPFPRIKQGHLLKLNPDKQGYPQAYLCKNNKLRYARVHHLVLEAFVGPRPPGLIGCHKNDINTDNALDNLYWGTHKQNSRDAKQNGKLSHNGGGKGERSPTAKLTEQDVRFIRLAYTPRNSEFGMLPLAKMFGVGKYTISDIVRNVTWKHLT